MENSKALSGFLFQQGANNMKIDVKKDNPKIKEMLIRELTEALEDKKASGVVVGIQSGNPVAIAFCYDMSIHFMRKKQNTFIVAFIAGEDRDIKKMSNYFIMNLCSLVKSF